MLKRLAAAGITAVLGVQAPVSSTAGGEWPTYGGDLANSKYSPLDQIDAVNFSTLRIAWRRESPDGFLSMTYPTGTEWHADSKTIFDELNRIEALRQHASVGWRRVRRQNRGIEVGLQPEELRGGSLDGV